MARAAVEAQYMAMVRKAASDAVRLNAADQAYSQGEFLVAGRLYLSLARKSMVAPQARERLKKLTDEALQRLETIEASLAEASGGVSPGELSGADGPPEAWKAQVTEAFAQYDELAGNYRWYRPVSSQVRNHVTKQRRRPEIASVLNEPEAKALWLSGQEHETDGNACCAYWCYQAAVKLVPAPSAKL
ncbi:MAG: hypothetical protein ACYTG0_39290, partial [Planctomycetota bacterium]